MKPVSSAQLTTWAGEARERWSVPGLVAGLLHDGQVVAAADGVRELGVDDPVEVESVFRIASITKPFVATLAMTLVQDGLLELDAPPPGSSVQATVRELLSHQGGLATEWPQATDGTNEGDDALLRLAEREPERLPVGPGELFAYSNAGYWYVGAAIASAAGMTFEEAMKLRVLEPLRLSTTGFGPSRGVPGHDESRPGARDQRPVTRRYPRVRRPSGGLWSTVGDLLRFAEHHLGGPGPLAPASVAEMQRPIVSGPGFACGLGWFLTRRGRLTVEHMGSVGGYQSLLLLVPGEQIAFAALTNSNRGLASIRDVAEQLGLGVDVAPNKPLSPEALEALAGRYLGQDLEIELAVTDGELELAFIDVDPLTGEEHKHQGVPTRSVGDREFEILAGEWRGERFDFPREGIVRLGTLAVRVE
jgi:CubicO group peptidase (beta-lactamase class C family)